MPSIDKPSPAVVRPSVRPDPTFATHPPVKPKSQQPVCAECKIEAMPSGEGVATIIIPAEVMRRLKTRAQGVSLDEYSWGVIRRALYAETFG